MSARRIVVAVILRNISFVLSAPARWGACVWGTGAALHLNNWGSLAGFAPGRESRTVEFKAASLTKPVNDLPRSSSTDVPPKAFSARPDRKEITLTFQTTYTHTLPHPFDPLPDPHFGYLVSNIC